MHTKEEIEKLDMFNLVQVLKTRNFGKASELAWDELIKRIGKLNDIKRIAAARKALGALTDDEVTSLLFYLFDSYHNDNGQVDNFVAGCALAGNEMVVKAVEVRCKILEAK